MAHTQQQITNRRTWIEIDGSNGTTFVDGEDASEVVEVLNVYGPTDNRENTDVELEMASTYYDGEVHAVSVRTGYGARMSASGYMDCTDWTVFDTEAEAQEYLDDTYGDDEDAEGEDDE